MSRAGKQDRLVITKEHVWLLDVMSDDMWPEGITNTTVYSYELITITE